MTPSAVISVLSTQIISTSWCFTTTRSTFKDHAKSPTLHIPDLFEPKTEVEDTPAQSVPTATAAPAPVVVTSDPDESLPFFTPEEQEAWNAEDHQSFYPESVPCEAKADPEEERESCLDPKCDRKFLNYFSMMRHFAFAHNPARTAKAMKLKVLKKSHVRMH